MKDTQKLRSDSRLEEIVKRVFERLFRKPIELFEKLVKNVVCAVGGYVVNSLIEKRKNGTQVEQMGQFLKNVCLDLRIEPEAVCHGAIDLNIVSAIFFSNFWEY